MASQHNAQDLIIVTRTLLSLHLRHPFLDLVRFFNGACISGVASEDMVFCGMQDCSA